MPGDGPRGDWQPPKPPGPKGPDRFSFGKKLIITIVVFCGLVFIIIVLPFTGVTKPLLPLGNLYGLDISLSEPKLSGINPSGTFRLYRKPFGFDSDGTGGACMIADIAGLVRADDPLKPELNAGTCNTDDECNPNPTQTWQGYCVPDYQNQHSRCWYRPADNDPDKKLLCRTSGHYKNPTDPPAFRGPPWPVGVLQNVPYAQTVPNTPRFDLQTFYRDHTNGRPAQWRLSGLLFGTAPGSVRTKYGNPACLSPDETKKCG